MSTLSEGHKLRLREKVIQGAKNYEKYLNSKSFKIICEDGTQTSVRFFQNDFKHLSGISSDLSENMFYTECYNTTLSIGNILETQKYNWATLKGKSDRLSELHNLLYTKTEKRLLLDTLITNTKVFPVGIRNDEINSCVGFVDEIHKARSLRKASSSKNAKTSKKIIAIFAKRDGAVFLDEIVYIENERKLLKVYPYILREVSSDIRRRLNRREKISRGYRSRQIRRNRHTRRSRHIRKIRYKKD